jgi:hypothetical protein
VLNIESLLSKGLGVIDGVSNIDVVKHNILGHGPKLNTDTTLFTWVSTLKLKRCLTYNLIEALYWGKVLEVIRVGDLARGPLALVCRIVDHFGEPFALIKRVRLVWAEKNRSIRIGDSNNEGNLLPLPLAATRSFDTLGVWNSRGDIVAIFLVIPLLGLLGIWMGA